MEEASQRRPVHQGLVGSGLQVCDDTASLIPRPSPTSGTPACWMLPCSLCHEVANAGANSHLGCHIMEVWATSELLLRFLSGERPEQ